MLNDRLATLKKAEAFARDGQVQDAIAEYLLLVEDQPGDWSAGNALGDLYLKTGQREHAADVFVQMADSQRDQGFVPKAVALYKKALKARAGDERALLGLADVALAQETFADARRYLQQVVDLRQARGDAAGAAACAERLAQVPARRVPGAQAAKPALPIVPPPSRSAPAPETPAVTAPPGDGPSAGTQPAETQSASNPSEDHDSLSLSLDVPDAPAVDARAPGAPDVTGGADASEHVLLDAAPHVGGAVSDVFAGSAGDADTPDTLTLSSDAPSNQVAVVEPVLERFGEPDVIAAVDVVAPAVAAADDPAPAVRAHDEMFDLAHDDGDGVDLAALLDAPFETPARPAPAPVIVPAPPTAATPATVPAATAPPVSVPSRTVERQAPAPAVPAKEVNVAPAPARAAAPSPASPGAPVTPAPASLGGPVTPVRPAPSPAAADPYAALAQPASTDDDLAGPEPDADALVAELEAAARVPALRFQASARLGRLLVERGDLSRAAEWLERAAQEPAPVPEHGLSVVYDLAVVYERLGQAARALALFAEIESESSAYRDVPARVARLSAGGGGRGA